MSKSSRAISLSFLAAIVLATAVAAAQERVTYNEHVRPIFQASCAACHNADKNTAGLNLTSYQSAIAGSSNGKVLNAGDPDGSRLYLSVTHQQEPKMPKGGSKLSDKHLETIRKWIEGGLLETAASVALAPSKPKLAMTLVTPTIGRPKGDPPMPKGVPLEPVVRADRTAAPAAMAASPWAPLVALAAPHQVLLYHAQMRDLLGVLPFPKGQAKTLNFSRGGGLLVAGGGVGAETGKAAVYDVVTGRRVAEVGDDYDEILAADISPDQSTVAMGGPSKVLQLYSLATGTLIKEIDGAHTDWILSIAYSPDGVLLASSDRNGGLRVWEAASGNEFYNLAGHKAAITSLRFRADSNVLASASEDGTVKLWDMNTGESIKSWPAHPGGVLSLDFAPDGRIVTAGRDQFVRLWKPDGAKLLDLERRRDVALQAVFAAEGALVAAADFSGDVRVNTAADGKRAGELDPNPPTIAERLAAARVRLDAAQSAAERASKAVASLDAAADKAEAALASARTEASGKQQAAAAAAATTSTSDDDQAEGPSTTQPAVAAPASLQPLEEASKTAADKLAKAKSVADAAAAELSAAKADLLKWKRAAVDADLARSAQEVEELSATGQQVTKALQQLEAANKALAEGPARLAAAEQRVAKAKVASTQAAERATAAEARRKELQSLADASEQAAKALQAASAKDGSSTALADAARKSTESAQLVATERDSATKGAAESDTAAKQAAAELATATGELATIKAETDAAPQRVEEAKSAIAAAATRRLEQAKARLEDLKAEQQRLKADGSTP